MRLLMHMCCAPCASYPIQKLREEGHEVYGLFYNPNIHPYTEYEKRLEAVKQLEKLYDMPMIYIDEYDLEEFLRRTVYRENIRCQYCYAMRLERAASVAKKGKFDAFTTSLLVSPMQKHDIIKELGKQAGKKFDTKFYYEDFRPYWKNSVERSKELGLYRQQYCGCIYSEKERYLRSEKKRS